MIRRAFVRRMASAALACGMLGSELLRRRDVWGSGIGSPTLYGANVDPVPVEDVMQRILDDWAPGTRLLVVGEPDLGILRYEQQLGPVMDALWDLADIGGFTLHPRGNGGLLLRDAEGL